MNNRKTKLELITPNNIKSPAVQRFMWNRILEQREQIIEAFIAETGCKPSECEQVMEATEGGYTWYVRKRGSE